MTRDIIIRDTYEASFYILNGGIIKSVEFRKVQPNQVKKEGFLISYKITMGNVEQKYIHQWKTHQAEGNFRDFANARRKLKRKVEKIRKRGSELAI